MQEFVENATLTDRKDLSDELSIFFVTPDSSQSTSFTPGQYAELGVAGITKSSGKPLRRQYSIASAPDLTYLEFLIVKVDDGAFTPTLWNLKVNDKLWVGEKTKGKFTLDEVPKDKRLVFIATGTGLAPYVSMLRAYRKRPRWEKVALIHGVRFATDLAYRDELETLANETDWFTYIPVVSREDDPKRLALTGRVQVALSDAHLAERTGWPLHSADCQVLLCGNPLMIEEVQEMLIEKGFSVHKKKSPGNIHVERYW